MLTFEAHLTAAEALEPSPTPTRRRCAARRQMLYPVVGDADRLLGVVTRTQLETAVHHGTAAPTVARPGHRTTRSSPIRTRPCARSPPRWPRHAVDRMPVVDRHDPNRIVGMISLTMLLAGRLRDLQEARDADRVLRLRVVRPRRAAREAN